MQQRWDNAPIDVGEVPDVGARQRGRYLLEPSPGRARHMVHVMRPPLPWGQQAASALKGVAAPPNFTRRLLS